MLWLRDNAGRTLLQRRPASGIWSSLWSLPEADDDEQISAIARRHARIETGIAITELPAIDHVFSHFRLRIQPRLIDAIAARSKVGENDGLRWASQRELASLGIPAPVRKLIEEEPQ